MRYLVRTAINTLDLWLYMLLVPGISLHGLDNNRDITLCLLAGGAVLGIISCLVRPTLMILPISLYILTLGLLFLMVSTTILRLIATLTVGFGIDVTVTTRMAAVMGGILLSLFNTSTDAMLPEEHRRRQAAGACLLGIAPDFLWPRPVRPQPVAASGFSWSCSAIRGAAPFPRPPQS